MSRLGCPRPVPPFAPVAPPHAMGRGRRGGGPPWPCPPGPSGSRWARGVGGAKAGASRLRRSGARGGGWGMTGPPGRREGTPPSGCARRRGATGAGSKGGGSPKVRGFDARERRTVPGAHASGKASRARLEAALAPARAGRPRPWRRGRHACAVASLRHPNLSPSPGATSALNVEAPGARTRLGGQVPAAKPVNHAPPSPRGDAPSVSRSRVRGDSIPSPKGLDPEP